MIRPAIHLRIIGVFWLISAVKRAMELWSFARHEPTSFGSDEGGVGFWILQVLVEVSFVLIVVMGWGLIRVRRRALAAAGFWGVISLAICVWFIVTQGTQHGSSPYVAMWIGVAVSVYTIFAVWRNGIREQPRINANYRE